MQVETDSTHSDPEHQPAENGLGPADDRPLTKAQKKRILSVLFGRLIMMHKNIMNLMGAVHVIIIVFSCLHIFTLGTVDSEKNACYLTWPLTHLFYAFINYIFAWFYFYNSCEIKNPKGHDVLLVSKKFLKVLFVFAFSPIPLKYLAQVYCRNWTLSWNAVAFQSLHVFGECMVMTIYFFWFERKYTGFTASRSFNSILEHKRGVLVIFCRFLRFVSAFLSF